MQDPALDAADAADAADAEGGANAPEEESLPAQRGPAARERELRRFVERAQRVGSQQSARRQSDRDAAPALYEELAAAAVERRPELVREQMRFGSPALVEILLGHARERARGAPAQAVELCELALAAVDGAERAGFGKDLPFELRAACWSRLAQARRLAEDYRGAEDALAAAGENLDVLECRAPERALFCREAGLLRRAQGRLDEALALLTRATQLYRDREEERDLGETLMERGWILAHEDPPAALGPLRHALKLVDPVRDPWAAVRTRQALALCYCELDMAREARRMLRSSKSLREAIREPVDRLHCAWAQGEVLDRLGATDEALGVLQWALAGLAERGRLFEAALVAVDLVEISTVEDRAAVLAQTRHRVENDLAPRLPDGAAAAVTIAVRLGGRKNLFVPCLLENVRRHLERARLDPQRLYEPSRDLRRVMVWDRQPESRRRKICQLLGIAESAAEEISRPPGRQIVPERLRRLLEWSYQELTGTRIEWAPPTSRRFDASIEATPP